MIRIYLEEVSRRLQTGKTFKKLMTYDFGYALEVVIDDKSIAMSYDQDKRLYVEYDPHNARLTLNTGGYFVLYINRSKD